MSKTGLWLLPTAHRVEQLRSLCQAMITMGVSTPGRILVQEDEYEELEELYTSIELPPKWYFISTTHSGLAAKCEEIFETNSLDDLDWVGIIADDNIPETVGWDTLLGAQANGYNIVASNDGWQAPTRLHGAVVFSIPLLRAVGYLSPPGLTHLYFDDVWETIGRETGMITWAMDVMVRHNHVSITGQSDRTSAAVMSYREADEKAFSNWRCNLRNSAVNAVFQLMKSYGMPIDQPDLSGFNLMLATPCGSGSYVRHYVKSIINTVSIIRKYGGHIEWVEMPECADIAAARAMLLGTFYRGVYTHILMVDDDMGWRPIDVVRMLLTRKNFIAAVGMKKIDDVVFACDNTDNTGRPHPLLQEGDTTVFTGKHLRVGGAFIMLDRNMVERMIQSFPELRFTDGKGSSDYALFDPLIKDGSRKSEDYAFCDRWRSIGGTIHLLADVQLEHVGNSVWSGALLDQLTGRI